MKGKINKVITFFVVIGLIISMVIIKNAVTIKVSKQNIEKQPEAGMTSLGRINNFMERFYTYDALIGKDSTESVWAFWDTNTKESERIKNVYCVQTGKNANNNTPYNIYDAYDIDDATINKYFGDAAHYHHFLYILENMFIVGRTGNDRQYMINSTNDKLNKYYSRNNYATVYNSMVGEVNSLDMAGNYNGTIDARYSGSGNSNIAFNVWSSLTGKRVSGKYTDPINRVDNFLAITQRYLLTSNVKQKDSNNYATNPVQAGYKWNFFKAVYPYGYVSQGTVPSNTQSYADALLKMLDEGFNNNTYDINKYKNFNPNNTYVNKDNAVYDSTTNRAGPFTVVNPNGYSISVSEVKFGADNKSYSVVDQNGDTVDLSSKTNSKEFYIQLNETLDNSNSLSVKFYIDFGDVTTARLLIPEKANGQLMATVDRAHQDKSVSWSMKIEVKPDIALKKYIYAVNGSVAAVPARLNDIDLSPLANSTSTNANYLMNKTPVKVQVGDTVTYAIQIFNEGKVNGTADEITDYLPANLSFVRAYTDFDAVHTPGYDGSNDIANTGTNSAIRLKNPNTSYITPYEDTDTKDTFIAKSQIIFIDCKVGISNNDYVYTNMAEISEYRMEAGSDVDSDASNWQAPSSDRSSQAWQDYSNGHSNENPSWFDNGFHNWGAQDNNGAGDDDDFDKIIIDHIDLALTKRIEGKLVSGTEEMLVPADSTTDKSRIVISGYDDVKNGTAPDLRYNMNKKVAHVQKEDKLVTVITVYNEGKIDGVVKEITDYLPVGLNYNALETAALNGPDVTFAYNNNTRFLTIRLNGNDGITLQNLNDYDNDPSNHKVDQYEVKIVLDVSKAASGRLYNSAAITSYGYVGADGEFYSAYASGVDKDSWAMQDANSLKSVHLSKHYTAESVMLDLTQFDKNDVQYQDDDDMDVVEVDYNPNFDLSLRKYIQKIEKDFDGDELIDETNPDGGYKKYSTIYERRVPELNEFSVNALDNTGTADYYHEKLKVVAEQGDLVTYRIRVYNEGKGDDCFGRATEITDYLPSELEFVSLEDGNDSGWSATSQGSKVILTYNGDKKLPTDSIQYLSYINRVKEIKERMDNGEEISVEDTTFYNTYSSLDEHNYYQEVGIICRVTANDDFKVITNRAAITDREAYKKVYTDETHYNLELDTTITDRDNDPQDELINPNLDSWYRDTVVNETTPREYYPGEEDDDDFDSLYVYNYDLTIRKTDKTNNLPGATFKVIKYRAKSTPRRDYYDQNLVELATIEPQVELTNLETSINTSGEGTYKTTAPVSEVENDVYIIKEIQGVDGHFNPFEGKYIKVSMRGIENEIHTNFSYLNMIPQYFEIYTDDGDDDYTNDQYIIDNFRDPYNIYKYVRFNTPGIGTHFEIEFVNNEIEIVKGKYTVRLTKYGIDADENEEQIAGVQFDASGKFNGGNTVDIPRTGAQIVSSATEYVTVLPESYTDGYVEIDPDEYQTPDEINIEETGISSSAVDGQGRPINRKYYAGLLGKELNIKINKTYSDYYDGNINKRSYSVDSIETTLDGEAFTNETTLSNGSKVVVSKTSSSTGAIIDVKMYNPVVVNEGTYHVKLIKYKQGSNTPVAGVKFTASAHIDGEDVNIAGTSNPIITGTTPVSVKDNVQMSEDNLNDADTYTLKEVDVGTNSDIYIGYTGNIGLRVTKRMDTSDPTKNVFLIDTVTLVVNGQDVPNNSITLNNGTKIEVSYNSTSKTIEVRVTDPIKEGSFKINLVKYKTVDENNDGNYDPLQGAVFNITVNDGTSDIKTVTNQTTNANGEIPTISGINITSENLTYTITVTEVSTPTGFIGIGEPVSFTAKPKFDGEKYILDTSVQPQISNRYVQAEVNEDEILIEAENRVEPVIHKGVKNVENQDSGYDKNEKQTWVINTTVPTGIGDYTKYIVTDTIDPEKTNVAEKRIAFINEANPASNVVVKYKGTNTTLTEGTDYKLTFNTTTKQLTIIFINVSTGSDNFVGGRSLTEETTLEITYNTKFTLDNNGDPIGLNQSIPNKATLTYNGNGSEEKTKDSETPEVHTGGLGVYKYDKSTNQALSGAKFRLTRTAEEAEAAVAALLAEDQAAIDAIDWVKKYNEDGSEGAVWEVTTGADGYAYFAGLEFGEDASDSNANRTQNGKGGSTVYEYDWETAKTTYYLVETYVPEDYILLDDIAAECEVSKDSFVKTDLTTYHRVGNEVVVPEGEYALEIAKYGRYQNDQGKELHAIAGVIFSAKRKINGLAEEDLGNLTATDSTGRTLIGDTVTIDKDQVNVDDEYTIHEVSIPEESEYYVGLEKDIKLTVSKQSVKSDDKKKWINSVTGINMSIEGETVTEVITGKKYTATVVKDGQELEITAELLEDNEGGQFVKLTVENPHKVGKFPLHIVKTIKGTNPARPLANAGFKVSIKQGENFVKDGNGVSINGTREYFTDSQGNILIDNIDISRPGLTYNVEIEETTVPEGYIGIADKITYTATSVIDGNKLSLQDANRVVVTNDVVVNVTDGEIWNYVEDKPEPEIHKGVKTVENQDSGYDGDEIQTWVINSSIPAGIEDYTKYVITDTIDPDKSNNDEKRIEFLGLNTIHVSIKGLAGELVQGEDYLASFDDTNKTITIKFIDGEFKKGQELPENSVLVITYNTKFRLDNNGLIIGLNQRIPNQAHLTFNGNGKEEKEKDSETPEVHTGAVGVLKYEDVNKNGVYDKDIDYTLKDAHFKIVRTKEEADKALAAVLAGDEETLSTINFIKVRDEDGNVTDVDVELITADDGTATYEGLEFGEDASDSNANRTQNGKGGSAVYGYDWETAKTTYYLVETEAPYDYYLLDRYETFEVSKNSFVRLDLTTYYKEADKPKIYDLSLRKFITHVNGTDVEGNAIDRNITDRIPQVTLTDEFKDKENDDVTTAIYKHTKEPVIVQQGNTVTYTIRVYNEGPEDAYAEIVKDDIPDGVMFVPYTEGDGSVNEEYRWKLVDENDNEVKDASKAKYIVTDYLSKEQGNVVDGVNVNLLKGFDSDTMKELDYRDLKVQFFVLEPNTSERIITNYAQIAKMTNSDGYVETDRDSTPNEWIEGEDDQDVEHIKLLYFDLALRKWVTKAIVISDGEEKVFETGHKAEDDPEDVVKVDLKKSKLDKVIVKFEYQIRITNEGRIGGWADEVTDHIPDGLTFDQADNPIWAVVDNKTVVTDALKNTYLEPGESAEVTIVLRWENSGDNLGIKVNIAEISKDRNEYGVHDIDSTPGNYKWGEDDIDDAPVMLAVTTGNRVLEFAILGLVIASILTVGAIAIKKVRNEKTYF